VLALIDLIEERCRLVGSLGCVDFEIVEREVGLLLARVLAWGALVGLRVECTQVLLHRCLHRCAGVLTQEIARVHVGAEVHLVLLRGCGCGCGVWAVWG
jgi:hypothetical protein